jgi:hypothetical protein
MKVQKIIGGPRGLAKVRINEAKTKAQILFKNDLEHPIILGIKEFPESILAGEFYISLNSTKDEVQAIRPANGTFSMKFKEFAHSRGEVPAPKFVPAGMSRGKMVLLFQWMNIMSMFHFSVLQGNTRG